MSAKKDYRDGKLSKKLADGVYSMWLAVGPMADEAKPGQFISVYSNDSSRLFRGQSVFARLTGSFAVSAWFTGSQAKEQRNFQSLRLDRE